MEEHVFAINDESGILSYQLTTIIGVPSEPQPEENNEVYQLSTQLDLFDDNGQY